MEKLAGLLELEELMELIKFIDDRVGRARGKKFTSVTTIKTRVAESGTVQIESVGIIKAIREKKFKLD